MQVTGKVVRQMSSFKFSYPVNYLHILTRCLNALFAFRMLSCS